MGLRHVLVVIRCLLIEPFPESALNEEAGRLLMEDYEQYAAHARLMTSIHATATRRCVRRHVPWPLVRCTAAFLAASVLRRCCCQHDGIGSLGAVGTHLCMAVRMWLGAYRCPLSGVLHAGR